MALPMLCDWLVQIKSRFFFTEIDCMASRLLCDWLLLIKSRFFFRGLSVLYGLPYVM